MELIVNYILLFVSGAACVYCFVLAKRLKRLNDTRDGIGASIVEMSASLSQTQRTLRLAREASVEGIDKLTALIEDAEKKVPEITELLDALDALGTITAEDIENAKTRALIAIDRRADSVIDIAAALDSTARTTRKRPSSRTAA